MALVFRSAAAGSRKACIPRPAAALGVLVPCSLLGLLRPASISARRCASHCVAHARLAARPLGGIGAARRWAGTPILQQHRGRALQAYDQEQLRLLDTDECILVDEHDKVLGHGSKKFCHLMENIDGHKALHRAFSIFLFDEHGRMLLQKRSADKILFPSRWTNTCCSHPLFNPRELDDPPSPTADGVRRAAVRKLGHELGISAETVTEDDLIYMTRILYKAAVEEDDVWGEHEVDYIFLAQVRDIKYSLNPNEVAEVSFVRRAELQQWLDDEAAGRIALSPWFRAVAGRLLPRWWDAMLEDGILGLVDRETIHTL